MGVFLPEFSTEITLEEMPGTKDRLPCQSSGMTCPYPARHRVTMSCCDNGKNLCSAHLYLVRVGFKKEWHRGAALFCPHCGQQWKTPRATYWGSVLQLRDL